MEKWRKKLQKYLSERRDCGSDLAGVELSALFPVLLRLAANAQVPVVAALPDAVAVDKLRGDLDEARRLLTFPLRVLYPGGGTRQTALPRRREPTGARA